MRVLLSRCISLHHQSHWFYDHYTLFMMCMLCPMVKPSRIISRMTYSYPASLPLWYLGAITCHSVYFRRQSTILRDEGRRMGIGVKKDGTISRLYSIILELKLQKQKYYLVQVVFDSVVKAVCCVSVAVPWNTNITLEEYTYITDPVPLAQFKLTFSPCKTYLWFSRAAVLMHFSRHQCYVLLLAVAVTGVC